MSQNTITLPALPVQHTRAQVLEATEAMQTRMAKLMDQRHCRVALFQEALDRLGREQQLLETLAELDVYKENAHRSLCVYCGHMSERMDDLEERWQYMNKHIAACPKHPLGLACQEIVRLEQEIQGLKDLLR